MKFFTFTSIQYVLPRDDIIFPHWSNRYDKGQYEAEIKPKDEPKK